MKFCCCKCLLLLASITLFSIFTDTFSLAAKQHTKQISVQEKLAKLEASSGGKIGVYVINTANNKRIAYRAKERFPMCSTNKIMGVAAILKKSMINHALFQEKIIYSNKDLVTYSPITKKHVIEGMTVVQLCAAAITLSDNTAINLLMQKLGGLQAINIFARSIGDNAFRLDRWEPTLNAVVPGDLRDTTTPMAMAKSLQRLVFGDVLALPQRKQLKSWLIHNTTGQQWIRAGIPKAWVVGDKTGTGGYGTTNDIAIIWPPNRVPIIVAIYFIQKEKNAVPRPDVISKATRILINAFYFKD